MYPNEDYSTAYEITDHLGNVRAVVRENVNVYTATMEDTGQMDTTNPRVEEMEYFNNLFETEVTDWRMNHTAPMPGREENPNKAAYLYWIDGQTVDKSVGPAIGLKVNAGDKLDIETYARYENKTSYNRDISLVALASLLGNNFAYTGLFEGSTVTQTISAFNGALGVAGFMGDGLEGDKPFATHWS